MYSKTDCKAALNEKADKVSHQKKAEPFFEAAKSKVSSVEVVITLVFPLMYLTVVPLLIEN